MHVVYAIRKQGLYRTGRGDVREQTDSECVEEDRQDSVQKRFSVLHVIKSILFVFTTFLLKC